MNNPEGIKALVAGDSRKPKFGEWLRGIYASERNPQRDGMYVRTVRRTGRFNAGVWYELTDGNGNFWRYESKSTVYLESLTAVAGDAEVVELGELTPERIEHIAGAVAAAWCKSDMMVRAKRCQLAAAALRQLATRQAVEGMVPDYAELLEAVRTLDSLAYLGDAIYGVREREGEGWEGRNVTAYSKAYEVVSKHLAAAAPQAGKGE